MNIEHTKYLSDVVSEPVYRLLSELALNYRSRHT